MWLTDQPGVPQCIISQATIALAAIVEMVSNPLSLLKKEKLMMENFFSQPK